MGRIFTEEDWEAFKKMETEDTWSWRVWSKFMLKATLQAFILDIPINLFDKFKLLRLRFRRWTWNLWN